MCPVARVGGDGSLRVGAPLDRSITPCVMDRRVHGDRLTGRPTRGYHGDTGSGRTFAPAPRGLAVHSPRSGVQCIQSASRAHPERIQSASRAHPERIQSASRAHPERIQSASRAHPDRIQIASRAHPDRVQIASRARPERIQIASRSRPDRVQIASRLWPWHGTTRARNAVHR